MIYNIFILPSLIEDFLLRNNIKRNSLDRISSSIFFYIIFFYIGSGIILTLDYFSTTQPLWSLINKNLFQ